MATPEAEEEAMAEPESEESGLYGNKSFPESEPESEWEAGKAEPEAEPDWSRAFDILGEAWEVHVYITATIFLAIAVLMLFSMCFYLKDRKALRKGKLTFTLQCLILKFVLLRGFCMLLNPYKTDTKYNGPIFSVLWALALPGLTASFSVLMLVLLDTTKMTIGPPRFQNLKSLMLFTAFHYLLVLTTEIIGCYVINACEAMLFACQLIFITYGLILGIGYCYISVAVSKNITTDNSNISENKKLRRLITIAALSSGTAFAISITHIYAAASEFGVFSDVRFVGAWDWWILQSVLRIEEIVSCSLVVAIALRNPCADNSVVDSGTSTRVMTLKNTTN